MKCKFWPHFQKIGEENVHLRAFLSTTVMPILGVGSLRLAVGSANFPVGCQVKRTPLKHQTKQNNKCTIAESTVDNGNREFWTNNITAMCSLKSPALPTNTGWIQWTVSTNDKQWKCAWLLTCNLWTFCLRPFIPVKALFFSLINFMTFKTL